MSTVNGLVPAQNQPGIELRRKDEERGEESELLQEEAPRAAAAAETSSLKPLSSIIFWKCKLWMVLTSVFLVLIFVIALSLILYSVVHIDEDEYWDPELIASGKQHNFSGIVNIKCPNPNVYLSESAYDVFAKNLNKRLKDVYSYSPALGRYFISSEVISFRENNTASYNLQFLVPPESADFMKYRMSKEFVMNILRQNIYDKQNISDLDIPECTDIILDPSSVTIKLT
ncbi:PREDICTED: TPA-induced transmembrane protein isoform X2 [Thamnophis sirtalis]|uniref:TPA-induced transmembrane protein isoform X2 n=1 Tax=Thamnophis sirtalis TaxID=35019 RepID=A0A6I9X341_9SAUR|nr:PREDICTED: TPA-induced transmembrane protein isoform X2 [Thamnophis sirtalis]